MGRIIPKQALRAKGNRISVKVRTQYKKNLLLVILILGSLGLGQGLQAQEYPVRPITLLIGNPPGAGTDLWARIIAQRATKTLGQEIIPVNKAGGTGAVAAGILANAKGDGYTLLASVSSAFTSIPHLESVPYDPFKDLIPVIQFGSLSTGIVVRSDSSWRSLKDFIEAARKNPGKISYGVPGIWIPPLLAMEHVMLVEKVNIPVIPFGGAAPTMTALLGGHVSSCGVTTSGFLPHVKAGKAKVLVVLANKRVDSLPNVPTISELGYLNSLFMEIYLISVPKGTPSAIVKKLEEAFRKAMEVPEFRTLAENLNLYEEKPLSGQKLKDYIEGGYAANGDIIRKANLSK